MHVELQKRVLPFLTQMFPKVQFIVSTHSPFVISSLRDAAVYDLETREQLENPGVYSYEAVVDRSLFAAFKREIIRRDPELAETFGFTPSKPANILCPALSSPPYEV